MLDLDDVKEHLRIEHDLDDSYLSGLIDVAIGIAENYTSSTLKSVTKELVLDRFSNVITLPCVPVISVQNITFKDINNDEQSFENFRLDNRSLNAKLETKKGHSWPETYNDKAVIKITYATGYDVFPSVIKQALLLIIGSLYDQRENHIVGTPINEIPLSAEYLLNPYRVSLI